MAASVGRGARLKGLRFQREIRDYLAEEGLEPLARPGGEDGDDLRLADLPMLSIELKNQARMDLPGWWRQAAHQAHQAGGLIPVLIWKRKAAGHPSGQWVTLELREFVRVCRLLRHVDPRDWAALANGFENLSSGEIAAALRLEFGAKNGQV